MLVVFERIQVYVNETNSIEDKGRNILSQVKHMIRDVEANHRQSLSARLCSFYERIHESLEDVPANGKEVEEFPKRHTVKKVVLAVALASSQSTKLAANSKRSGYLLAEGRATRT